MGNCTISLQAFSTSLLEMYHEVEAVIHTSSSTTERKTFEEIWDGSYSQTYRSWFERISKYDIDMYFARSLSKVMFIITKRKQDIPLSLEVKKSCILEHCVPNQLTIWLVWPLEASKKAVLHTGCADSAWQLKMQPRLRQAKHMCEQIMPVFKFIWKKIHSYNNSEFFTKGSKK